MCHNAIAIYVYRPIWIYRVNEFNVADVLALFFPYHESPHFAKMVSILQLECVDSMLSLDLCAANLLRSQEYKLCVLNAVQASCQTTPSECPCGRDA